MELVFIKQGTEKWEEIWNWLEQNPINEGIDNPRVATHTNESWQYMGSYLQKGKAVSEFRHRNHPKTLKRVSLSYGHSVEDDDLQKSVKIK